MKNLKLLVKLIIAVQILFALFSCSDSPTDYYEPPRIDPPIYPCPYQEPSVTFDGKKIVFYRNKVIKISKSGYSVEIDPDSTGFWICNIDGSEMEMIYKNASDIISNPQFTTDMKELFFVKNAQICKTQYNGKLITEEYIQQLTTEGRNFFPSISHDGSLIAYDSNKDSPVGGYRIWHMKADGTNKSLLVDGRMPCWSNDSKWIFYIGFHSEIYKVNVNNIAEVIKITHLNEIDIYATDNRYPKFSSSSLNIAYTSQSKDGYPQIWLIDSSNQTHQLTLDGVYSNCSWTPDDKIVYVHYAPFNYNENNGTLWIMNKDGSNKKQLTFNHGLQLE